jgi:hypothetical protein
LFEIRGKVLLPRSEGQDLFHFYFAISATCHLFIDLKACPYPLFPLSKPSKQSHGNDDIGKGT